MKLTSDSNDTQQRLVALKRRFTWLFSTSFNSDPADCKRSINMFVNAAAKNKDATDLIIKDLLTNNN